MKKISILLITLIMTLFISSCANTQYKYYGIGDEKRFIDKIYEYVDEEKHEYCLVDVRTLEEEYAQGHFFGFINYDIKNGTIEEFIYKMESMYSKNRAVFIIDSDGTYVDNLLKVLKDKGYKKIYVYEGGYSRLVAANNGDFSIVTGTDDCGC